VVLTFEMQKQFVFFVELLMTIEKRTSKKRKRASSKSKKKEKIDLDTYGDMGLLVYRSILFLLAAALSLVISKDNLKVAHQ